MRIEKFLKWIQDKLLNYPDISFEMVKMFTDKFYYYLSDKEKERYSLQSQMIKEYTLKQISLDSFVHNSKIENLSNQLEKIKGSENKNGKKE